MLSHDKLFSRACVGRQGGECWHGTCVSLLAEKATDRTGAAAESRSMEGQGGLRRRPEMLRSSHPVLLSVEQCSSPLSPRGARCEAGPNRSCVAPFHGLPSTTRRVTICTAAGIGGNRSPAAVPWPACAAPQVSLLSPGCALPNPRPLCIPHRRDAIPLIIETAFLSCRSDTVFGSPTPASRSAF